MWNRVLIAIPLWFFVTRIAKEKYMKKNNNDSHDASMRDVTAHMWNELKNKTKDINLFKHKFLLKVIKSKQVFILFFITLLIN